jgi:hypothetical protein
MDTADFNLVPVHKYNSQKPYQVQRSAKKCLKIGHGNSSPQFLPNWSRHRQDYTVYPIKIRIKAQSELEQEISS